MSNHRNKKVAKSIRQARSGVGRCLGASSIDSFALADRLVGCCAEEATVLGKIDVDRFLIPKHVQNALEHGGGQMHPDDPATVRIGFEKHPGVVESNPRQCLA